MLRLIVNAVEMARDLFALGSFLGVVAFWSLYFRGAF